jgi:hypothetical protein
VKLLDAIRLALIAYIVTVTLRLEDRLDEIDVQIDRLGIDAAESELLHIERLNRERGRKAQLLRPLRSALSALD